MDKLIASYKNYSIWQVSRSGLYDLAKFVVLENYKHHKNVTKINHNEIQAVYNEENRFFSQSKVFVAKNNNNKIVGTIRVMEWSGQEELPITKLFGIQNLHEISPEDSNAHVWHIGRFAVNSDLGRYGISLFKILMLHAISPICRHKKGIMFAECDSKLFKIVNHLGIKAIALNKGIEYLGSLTIPMYATCSGMMEFYIRNRTSEAGIKNEFNGNIGSIPFFSAKLSLNITNDCFI
jgi:hypothetical protein